MSKERSGSLAKFFDGLGRLSIGVHSGLQAGLVNFSPVGIGLQFVGSLFGTRKERAAVKGHDADVKLLEVPENREKFTSYFSELVEAQDELRQRSSDDRLQQMAVEVVDYLNDHREFMGPAKASPEKVVEALQAHYRKLAQKSRIEAGANIISAVVLMCFFIIAVTNPHLALGMAFGAVALGFAVDKGKWIAQHFATKKSTENSSPPTQTNQSKADKICMAMLSAAPLFAMSVMFLGGPPVLIYVAIGFAAPAALRLLAKGLDKAVRWSRRSAARRRIGRAERELDDLKHRSNGADAIDNERQRLRVKIDSEKKLVERLGKRSSSNSEFADELRDKFGQLGSSSPPNPSP